MKKPSPKKTPIDNKRLKKWLDDFSGFRHQVPESRIRDWLLQYDEHDRDLAARLLDCVDFFNNEQIRAAFRTILGNLPGWNPAKPKRTGRWRFAPYSSSSGESGDSMMHVFRQANNLASAKFNDLFIYRSELVSERLGFDDTVVLVDDMVGTGDQVCRAWDQGFGELLAEVGNVYLVVVAACFGAAQRISDGTAINLAPHFQLSEADNFFSNACKHFDNEEKATMLKYCQKVSSDKPKGHGESGLVIVFAHTIPNNSLPVLSKSTKDWEPLFRRYD